MTLKQKVFTKMYIQTGNGTQAAFHAYNTNKPSVAAQIAYENLRKPEIKNMINGYFEREDLILTYLLKAQKTLLTTGLQGTNSKL